MGAVDAVFLIVLLGSLLLGAWRGLVYELLSLAAWVGAFILAWLGAPALAPLLPMGQASAVLRHAAAFVVLLVGGVLLGSLLAMGARGLLGAVGLRAADRGLGAFFGLVRGVLLLMLATALVGLTPLTASSAWQESHGVAWTRQLLHGLRPSLPAQWGRWLSP
ncbi:MAG: CvpA family protein [Rhodoferax sp.]